MPLFLFFYPLFKLFFNIILLLPFVNIYLSEVCYVHVQSLSRSVAKATNHMTFIFSSNLKDRAVTMVTRGSLNEHERYFLNSCFVPFDALGKKFLKRNMKHLTSKKGFT